MGGDGRGFLLLKPGVLSLGRLLFEALPSPGSCRSQNSPSLIGLPSPPLELSHQNSIAHHAGTSNDPDAESTGR